MRMKGRFLRAFMTISITLICLLASRIHGFDADDPGRPCLDCHAQEALKAVPISLNDAHVHHPVAMKRCRSCHAEEKRGLANDPMLCFTCHDIQRFKGKQYRHPPLGEKNYCLSCHRVHSSDHEFLLKDDPIDFCQPCHAETRAARSHPIGGRIMDPMCNRTMTCTSTCHSVHLSDYPALISDKGRELCRRCHSDTLR